MNTNKIDLIKAEVKKLHGNPYYMMAVKDVLAIIDSLQEEPSLSNKHSVDEAMAEIERKAKLFTEANKGKTSEEILAEMRGVEPVSEDFEKIVEEIAEPTILNAYGTKELARRLRNTICGISISEDLGEYINELSKQFPEISFAKLSRIVVRVAKWQKEQMMAKAIEAVVSQVPCSNEIILYNPSSVYKYSLPQEMNKLGLNKGDKVKLVIIKEE